MRVFKFIIEGPNLSGKDRICNALEDFFTESIKIVCHGYYPPETVGHFEGDVQAMAVYGKRKLSTFLPLIQQSIEPLIFLRFHLTDWAYLRLFHGLETPDYQDIENQLNRAKIALVVLDVSDEALERRLKERQRVGKSGPWDRELKSLTRKRDVYRDIFSRSAITDKLLLDTSDTTAEEAASKIINWWKTLT